MIKKRYYVVGALVILLFLGAGPIIINKLMFEQDWAKVKGDEALWIPSLATYFGAIIGGVISGFLTLLGVRLTIKSSAEQVNETILEQQRIREEELKNNAVKEQLFKLYHPISSLISAFEFQHGAHNFYELYEGERIELLAILNENEIYAEKELYVKIIEFRWAIKEMEKSIVIQRYDEIRDLVTETIYIMKEQLKLPNQEL